eukprot:4490839-Amphidinium_carterae.1
MESCTTADETCNGKSTPLCLESHRTESNDSIVLVTAAYLDSLMWTYNCSWGTKMLAAKQAQCTSTCAPLHGLPSASQLRKASIPQCSKDVQ